MKKFNKNLIVFVLAFALVFGFTGQVAHAALAPGFLGVATGYSVFGDAGISEAGTNTPNALWGDIGINGVALSPTAQGEQVGAFHATDTDPVSGAIVSATGAAHLALAPTQQSPTATVDLSANDISVGPGVYTIVGGGVFSKTLTLNGSGTYIFQYDGTIAQSGSGTMILDGACASDVYWYTPTDMTFATGGNFFGTISAGTKITFAAAATLQGRAWAGTYVALHNQTITEPTCTGTLNVIKVVNGGSADPADFSMHVKDDSVNDVTDSSEIPVISPQPGEGLPGTAYALPVGTYTLSESGGPSRYTASTWSCLTDNDTPVTVTNASVVIASGDDVTCTITNTYHAPSSGSSGSSPVIPVFQPSITILSTPVIVAPIIPKLPKTGFAPQEKSTMLPIVLLSGLSLVLIFLYFAQKKQTT